MNKVLKDKLKDLADGFSEEGIEVLERLESDDFKRLETMFNDELTFELQDAEQIKIIKLRYLFRIWDKYGVQIMQGIIQLQEYQS